METGPNKFDADTLRRAIVERAATLLVEDLIGSLSSRRASHETETNGSRATAKKGKRKRRKRAAAVPDQELVKLIRARGEPLSVVDIQGATGLGQSAISRKLANLRKDNAIKKVKEGKTVRYDVVRGGHARRTAKKASKKAAAVASA
jgi:DNA-binding transcriptional ArsR family regulator